MSTLSLDEQGRLAMPPELREQLGIHPGDALYYAVVDGELRLCKSADPYAHLTDDELVIADSAWLEAHPEEIERINKEMKLWKTTLTDGLEAEGWSDHDSAAE